LRKLLDVELTLSDPDLLLDPDPDPIWPTSGSDFLQFDLRLCLGVGAAARAYLARDRNLGNRYVALKVCRLGGAEAETLGKLQHANVVPVLSVHFEKQRALTVVCMPYLGGATLQDVINLAFQDAEIPHQADVILEAARDCPLLGEFIRNE